MVFHWNPLFKVSRTLLSILADLKNAVVGVVSIIPLISYPSILFLSFLWLFQLHQQQLVSTALACFTAFFSSQTRSKYLFIFSLTFILNHLWQNPLNKKFFSFFYLAVGLLFRPVLDYPFVLQNPREFYASHSLEQILIFAYTIWLYGKISISCIISSRSPFPPSHA